MMTKFEWRWVSLKAAMASHAEQLDEHSGGAGISDLARLESDMARPQQLDAYSNPDAASLAAEYAFRIARNHPFVDGNKRTAAVISNVFLLKNGLTINASDADMLVAFIDLAAGKLTENELADWFRQRIVSA